MSLQPGEGYTFASSDSGTTLDIKKGWVGSGDSGLGLQVNFNYNSTDKLPQHWQAVVTGVPGDWRLRIARSGNIWRPVGEDCDKEYLVETVTVAASVTPQVPVANSQSPFCNGDSYIPINPAYEYYLYAYKVEEIGVATTFYAYVTLVAPLTIVTCPVVLPDEIPTPTGEYTAQVLQAAFVYYGADLQWHSYQTILGTIAWPQDVPVLAETPNHFEAKIEGAFFKVAKGGNIWRPTWSNCDKQKLADEVYVDAALVQTYSTGTGSSGQPWLQQDGKMDLVPAINYYVYAVRLQADEQDYFYIYISGSSDLDTVCPNVKPAEIPYPTGGAYTPVQVKTHILQVAHLFPVGEAHEVIQKISGSITWPTPEVIEQFTVRVIDVIDGETQGAAVQVAMGRVLNRCADFVTSTYQSIESDVNYVPYVPNCLKEWDVKGFSIYETGTLLGVGGGQAEDIWASQGGHVILPDAPAAPYGVYLVLNQFDPTGNLPGAPYLAVIAEDENEAQEKSKPFDDGCDAIKYNSYQTLYDNTVGSPYNYYTISAGDGSSDFIVINYNCQRVKIATLSKSSGAWTIAQHLIGTLTIPSPTQYTGAGAFILYNPTIDLGLMIDPYNAAGYPLYSSQNTAWNGAWAGYTKDFGANTVEIPL